MGQDLKGVWINEKPALVAVGVGFKDFEPYRHFSYDRDKVHRLGERPVHNRIATRGSPYAR